jgi:hypothetical protein
MDPPNTDEFSTSDLAIASFIVAREQYPLLRVDDTDPQRVRFVFPAGAAMLARAFYQPGADTVSARRFHAALRELRGLARGGGRFS